MKQVFNPLSGQFDTVLSAASELPYDNTTSLLTAINVQDAIDEIQGEINALPDPITYQGTWSAATNTPTLANTDTGVTGYLYQVSAAGTVDFGAGPISFEIGDKVVNNGSEWEKWDMTDSVTSVNSQTGVVVLTTTNISEGTNLYFTDTRARTAAVVNSTAGSEINQAPSVDAIKTYIPTVAANKTLSNLTSPTSINQDLLPSGSKNIGSSSAAFDIIYGKTGLILRNSGLTDNILAIINADLTGPLGTTITGRVDGQRSKAVLPNPFGIVTENISTTATSSRDLLVSTGRGTGASTASGDLLLATGLATGTRGKIKLINGSEGTSGDIWTSTGTDGSGTWVTPAAGANTALSNLASVAINTSLISDTDITDDLGSGTKRWASLYAQSAKDASSIASVSFQDRTLLDSLGNIAIDFSHFKFCKLKADLNTGGVRIFELYTDTNDYAIRLQAPTGLTSAVSFQLPPNTGTNGYLLTTDGTGVTTWAAPTTILKSTLSAKGSLVAASAAATPIDMPVGVDGTFLQADSAQTTGLSYGSPASTYGYRSVVTTDTPSTTADTTLDCSGASFTLTLPTPATGKIYNIIHSGTSLTQVYTLATTAGATIGGVASGSYALYTNGERLTVQYNGTNWIILSHDATTEWAASTPATQGFGTVSSLDSQWRRVGDSIQMMYKFTAGTVTASEAQVGLPVTTADTSKIPSIRSAGAWTRSGATSAVATFQLIEPSVAYVTFGKSTGTTNMLTKQGGTGIIGNSEVVSGIVVVPVAGWQP
jgi:hypothetical protein